MADTTTNLKIRTDDRDIKKLKASVKDTFDPRTMRGFRDATRDVERQLVTLTREQVKLTKQLEGIEKGTKAFKDMKEQIKGVADQTKVAMSALSNLDRMQQRGIRQAETSSGRRFGQGLAQGAGVAQYIPTRPGMGAQIAGATLAGGIRRAASMAAAPFTMPGIGGLSQGLSGIPLVGGMAAGAIQQAAAAYQSTVQFDKARMQNMYFANAPQARANRRAASAASLKARAARGDIHATLQTVVSGEAPRTAASGAPQSYAPGEGVAPYVDPFSGNALKASAPKTQAGLDRSVGAAARMKGLSARANRAEAADKRAKAGDLTGLGSMDLGNRFGFGPTQTEGLKGQMFGARGGMFNRGEFNQAMAAQVGFGVSMQQSGQFGRMGLEGGGGAGMGGGIAQVLQTAVAVGLSGAQVPELLGTLVGLGQAAEKQGIKLNVTEFSKMTMQLRQSGMQGLQGQRIAGGFTQAAQGLSGRGVQSPMDVLMMRAAGFKPEQGPEGFAAAKERLESPDAALMAKSFQMIGQGSKGMGSGMGRYLSKMALQKIGVNVGQRQAGQLTGGFAGGAPDIAGLLGKRDAQGGAAGLIRAGLANVPGTQREAAGLESQRISVGRTAGWIVEYEKNTMRMAATTRHFADDLKLLSGAVKAFIGFIDKLAGGSGGLMKNFAQITNTSKLLGYQ